MKDRYITKDGKKLRCGYTTGSAAAAASKAAALMLLFGERIEHVHLVTPNGTELLLAIEDIEIGSDFVSCAVKKDAGDDPDVTNGIQIYAKAARFSAQQPEIRIEGGKGVGRVTKAGLDQPPGAAAINSVPREMIRLELLEVMEKAGYIGGLLIEISVPGGEEIAARTFNPRLGIVGGISILGTTGIVEPMSDAAVIDTIRIEMNVKRTAGFEYLLLTPGNYGEDFLSGTMGFPIGTAVKCSNYIGEALEHAVSVGFRGVLLVGHIGKLVKLACGMMNTHSRYGDCRAEIFASHAALCGADTDTVRKLMESVMTDDMLDIVKQEGLLSSVACSIGEKIAFHVTEKMKGVTEVGIVVFSNRKGVFFQTPNVPDLVIKTKHEMDDQLIEVEKN